jgi:FTR1 family protein
VQTILETVTYLVAATVLTYMTFWMRKHARSLSKELRERAEAALDGRARWGLGLLAFQAVGEGLETVVFTLAIIFSTSTAGALTGAVIGLAGALGIAFVIYRLGHRLNLARFGDVLHSFFGYSDAPGAAADADLRRLPGRRGNSLPWPPGPARSPSSPVVSCCPALGGSRL